MKKTFSFIIILFFMGCKNDAELSMERGIQFYEWDKIEESILEFRHVIYNLESRNQKRKFEDIKLLSRAHHNLAVAYAKKKWYANAVVEARKAFDLMPTEDNHKVLELIQKKESKEFKKIESKPEKIDSTSL